MLIEIRCDKFAKEHRVIPLNAGLNTVLGSSGGSNAIGKSTFLWIIDYAFGGENYCSSSSDIKKNVDSHTIYFTFSFGEQLHFFYRNTDSARQVYRCDKDGHLIETMSLADYRAFLYQEYKIARPGIAFSDIAARYFRIYGRENTQERYPLLVKPRESDEKAVDFLMQLFNYNGILASIRHMEEELGVKASQLKSRQRQPVDLERIKANEETIESLRKRLDKLIQSSEEAQLAFFGFDTNTLEKVSAAQKELRGLVRKHNRLQSQVDALKDSMTLNGQDAEEEFKSLLQFFPDANLKAFSDVEHFHVRIREILNEEMKQEIARIQPVIQRCDNEINRLKKRIEETGLAKEMSERTLSQCVNISKRIDSLEEENGELRRQKELQDARVQAERQLKKLLSQQSEKLEYIQDSINLQMEAINSVVTEEQETAPILQILPYKEIAFGTPGNTSEGSAYKGLVLYDLSILELCPVPALIHDSNILKRIGDVQFEHILEKYQETGRQIFIAFDKADSATEKARKILDDTSILKLADGTELFGFSWHKLESNE